MTQTLRRLWLVLVVALALVGCTENKTETFAAADISAAGYGGKFRLADSRGRVRTPADFNGKVVLLFFGYTHCPDVCLTVLAQLAQVMKALGKDAERVQVLFVTLDPERDSADRLDGFVKYFHPDFQALRGDEASTAQTAREFGVSYSRHDLGSAAGYLLDHSAGVYVLDARGHLRLLIDYGSDLAAIVHDVKLLLDEKP